MRNTQQCPLHIYTYTQLEQLSIKMAKTSPRGRCGQILPRGRERIGSVRVRTIELVDIECVLGDVSGVQILPL